MASEARSMLPLCARCSWLDSQGTVGSGDGAHRRIGANTRWGATGKHTAQHSAGHQCTRSPTAQLFQSVTVSKHKNACNAGGQGSNRSTRLVQGVAA